MLDFKYLRICIDSSDWLMERIALPEWLLSMPPVEVVGCKVRVTPLIRRTVQPSSFPWGMQVIGTIQWIQKTIIQWDQKRRNNTTMPFWCEKAI